ncbi:magnesium transporter CorA family protein [bacterium]|nr:magnesium transporter CorA family protein [bacterium]MBU0900226.1 magnesium transporter CorA family protein [bacterium]MBU1153724.1 magnesium transporter CorA family protein [bacterium]
MLKKYQISSGQIVESNEEKSPILIYFNPDETEKRFLVEHYKIDEHTLNSALDPDEPSRLEFEPNHLAFILKWPKNYSANDQLLFKTATTGVFLFGNLLILVLNEQTIIFEKKHFTKVTSLTNLILKLVYRSIYHFLEHLRVMMMLSDDLEQKIQHSMENRYLISLFTIQKSLVYYLNAIDSNGVFMEKLKNNAKKIGFIQEDLEFLDDIIIENNQCSRQANIYSSILAGLMDARASIVNNNLNILMKTLNIVVIALMVPTLVVSVFSMNVKIPLQNLPYVFWIIIGLAVVSVVSFLMFWRHKK